MFEVGRLLILAFVVLSITYFIVVTSLAYNRRNDKSFTGGYFILMSWWLLWPYGKSGVPRDCKYLVAHGRVAFILFYISMFILWWLTV